MISQFENFDFLRDCQHLNDDKNCQLYSPATTYCCRANLLIPETFRGTQRLCTVVGDSTFSALMPPLDFSRSGINLKFNTVSRN